METITKQNQTATEREQILRSAIASFKISGIVISEEAAKEVFKKVVADLENCGR